MVVITCKLAQLKSTHIPFQYAACSSVSLCYMLNLAGSRQQLACRVLAAAAEATHWLALL
jgi:hypothetical protein